MGLAAPEPRLCVRSLGATYTPGYTTGGHDHSWGQLVFGVRGVIRAEVGDGVWFVPPTRALWVPPRVHHCLTMQGEVAMRTLYLSPERAAGLPAQARALEVGPLLRELILHVLAVEMLDAALPEHDRLAAVLVDRIAAAPTEDLRLPLPLDPRARAAAEWLQEHPGERRDLCEVARRSGASLRTLQRLFADQTGFSLEAWRQKARLIHGVSRLSEGASVTEAALDCGYESTSAFIAAFRRQFGVTPGRYRGVPRTSAGAAARSA